MNHEQIPICLSDIGVEPVLGLHTLSALWDARDTAPFPCGFYSRLARENRQERERRCKHPGRDANILKRHLYPSF